MSASILKFEMADCPTGILVDLSDDVNSENASVKKNSFKQGRKKKGNGEKSNMTSNESLNCSLIEDETLDLFSDEDNNNENYVFRDLFKNLSVKDSVEIFTEATKLYSLIKSISLKEDEYDCDDKIKEENQSQVNNNISGSVNEDVSSKPSSNSDTFISLPDEFSLLRDSALSNNSKDEYCVDITQYSVSSIQSTSSDSHNSSKIRCLNSSNYQKGSNLKSGYQHRNSRSSSTSSLRSKEEDKPQRKRRSVDPENGTKVKSSNGFLKPVKNTKSLKESCVSKTIPTFSSKIESIPEKNRTQNLFLTPSKATPLKSLKQKPGLTTSTPTTHANRRKSLSAPSNLIQPRFGTPNLSRKSIIYPYPTQTPKPILSSVNMSSKVVKKDIFESKVSKFNGKLIKKEKENWK